MSDGPHRSPPDETALADRGGARRQALIYRPGDHRRARAGARAGLPHRDLKAQLERKQND